MIDASADFIETYPNALTPALCAEIIAYFNRCKQAVRGATGSGVDIALKDSWDITISGKPDWKAFNDAIQGAAFNALLHYVRKYRYTVLAPLSLKKRDEGGQLTPVVYDDLAHMPDALLGQMLQYALRPGTINVQKYLADQGGYPYWHCEHYPQRGEIDPLHRVLLYTIYLNQEFSAGETEFFYQRRKIAPQTGSLLIAPAFFTHTHRGNRPIGGDKYIATSWILFQRAEQLFPS